MISSLVVSGSTLTAAKSGGAIEGKLGDDVNEALLPDAVSVIGLLPAVALDCPVETSLRRRRPISLG
jgi:hypothetical protein